MSVSFSVTLQAEFCDTARPNRGVAVADFGLAEGPIFAASSFSRRNRAGSGRKGIFPQKGAIQGLNQ